MSTPSDARFLLWGGRGSGKSGFLGALWHVDEATPQGEDCWAISPQDIEDDYSAAYLQSARQDLLTRTRRATHPLSEYQVVRVTARKWRNRSPVAAVPLAFRDPAGEFAEDVARAEATAGQLLDDMVNAAGIIWLFEAGAGAPPELAEIVRHIGVLRQRNGGRPIRTPVALCASKIDLLPEDGKKAALRDPRSAVMDVASPVIVDQLVGTFVNHRFFAFTSRGSLEDEIRPEGIAEILDWAYAEHRKRRFGAALRAHWRRAAKLVLAGLALLLLLGTIRWYVSGPPAEARRATERETLGRLELARQLYREGHMDSVLAVLHPPELRDSHPERLDWDTLTAFAAYQAGFAARLAGHDADSLLELAIARTEQALERVQDAAVQARIRYRHAEACISRKCPGRSIRQDLQFVLDHAGDEALRRAARDRLSALEDS